MAGRSRSIELTGGSYAGRSLWIAAQTCLNLYPEAVPQAEGEPVRFVDYPTNGLSLIATTPAARNIRGMYLASDGKLYVVAGNNLYSFTSGAFNLLGAIAGAASTARARMADNGVGLLIANGTNLMTTLTLATGVVGSVSHPAGGTFSAYNVEYVDTFFIIDQVTVATGLPTPIFWVSDSASFTFNALSFAAKASRADALNAIRIVHRNLWLIGQTATEVWYNAGGGGGNQSFPFALQPGVFIEYGTGNRDTVATGNNAVFWLSSQRDGQLLVMRGSALEAVRISTHSLEDHWQAASLSGLNMLDTYGFTYELSGHEFYVLNFNALNETWVWDDTTSLWHQRAWTNPAGGSQNLARGAFASTYLGNVVIGDRSNGKLYYATNSGYTDDGDPVTRQRSFPHLKQAGLNRVVYNAFQADMQTGGVVGSTDILLDWSDDGGQTWGTPVTQTLGALGDTLAQPQWRRLGYSRNRVFRLTWTGNGPTSLSAAFIDYTDAST